MLLTVVIWTHVTGPLRASRIYTNLGSQKSYDLSNLCAKSQENPRISSREAGNRSGQTEVRKHRPITESSITSFRCLQSVKIVKRIIESSVMRL